MKPQRVVATKAAATSAKPTFRTLTVPNQPSDHLAYKDLIRKLGTDFETSPSTWRRAVDHSAETVVFYQVDLRGDVPRMSKSVRICREQGPGKKGSGAKHLVPSVYVGDMLLEQTYVTGIIGQKFLVDEDDLMKLLEQADLLYTTDAAEKEDEEMVDGTADEVVEEDTADEVVEEDDFPVRAKAKVGKLDAVLKSPPKQRPTKPNIRGKEGKAAKKRKNGSVSSDDAASESVEKSDIVPVPKSTKSRKTRVNGVKVHKKRTVNQAEEDSLASDPDYSSPEPERGRSDQKRRKPPPSRTAITSSSPRTTRSGILRPTPPIDDVVVLDSDNPTEESSPVSGLPADDEDEVVPVGRGKKKSGQSGENSSTVEDVMTDEEEVTEPASAENRLTCPQCPATFATAFTRERHIREHHLNLDRTPCPKCDKPIIQRYLGKHLLTHKSERKTRQVASSQREASENL